MKFPLASPPFPSLQLSVTQCAMYQQLAQQLLNETIIEYDHFVRVQRRVLNKKEWKPVKRRENVTVYKQRGEATDTDDGSDRSSCSDGSAAAASTAPTARVPKTNYSSWSLPKMLAVGTIVGRRDDVMYGIISPDEDAIKIKTQYVHDELIDGRRLFQIKYPTEQDPFQYLAIKWFVKAHPASVNALVWPRDLVFIEATGDYRLPNGRKIGYHLLQSVDIPECPELTHMGIMRCQFSSCFLFRQRDDKTTVEVYMKSHLEPGGVIPEVVAVMSSANAMIGCWKSVWCAQNKKLAWMLRDTAAARAREHQFQDCSTKIVVHTNADGKRCCGLCTKTLHKLRRVITCDLCRTAVCSRCHTARKLAHVRPSGEVAMTTTGFCKTCITKAQSLSSADVARYEYVPGALEKRRCRARSDDIRVAVQPKPRTRRGSTSSPRERRLQCSRGPSTSAPSIVLLEENYEWEDSRVESIDEWGREHSMGSSDVVEATGTTEQKKNLARSSHETVSSPDEKPLRHQQLVWQKMTELCAQVERTYQLTKETNKNLERQ